MLVQRRKLCRTGENSIAARVLAQWEWAGTTSIVRLIATLVEVPPYA